MPYFICPNCRDRSLDSDGREGLSHQAVGCRRCGFGFLFELLDDYYPTGGRPRGLRPEGARLAAGRGTFELTGFRETDLIGRTLRDAFSLHDSRRTPIPSPWRSSGACASSAAPA